MTISAWRIIVKRIVMLWHRGILMCGRRGVVSAARAGEYLASSTMTWRREEISGGGEIRRASSSLVAAARQCWRGRRRHRRVGIVVGDDDDDGGAGASSAGGDRRHHRGRILLSSFVYRALPTLPPLPACVPTPPAAFIPAAAMLLLPSHYRYPITSCYKMPRPARVLPSFAACGVRCRAATTYLPPPATALRPCRAHFAFAAATYVPACCRMLLLYHRTPCCFAMLAGACTATCFIAVIFAFTYLPMPLCHACVLLLQIVLPAFSHFVAVTAPHTVDAKYMLSTPSSFAG